MYELAVHGLAVHKARRDKTRRDESRRKERRGGLKLIFLWVRGLFAFRKNINIVLKPIILCVCGPRTRLRVEFALGLVQSDRAPNPQFLWFQTEFRRFVRPHGMASNSHFSEFWARFIIFQKSSSLPLTDMQDAKNNALQNREFGKRFRTTSGNPKLR